MCSIRMQRHHLGRILRCVSEQWRWLVVAGRTLAIFTSPSLTSLSELTRTDRHLHHRVAWPGRLHNCNLDPSSEIILNIHLLIVVVAN